jgi:hypothetical protein
MSASAPMLARLRRGREWGACLFVALLFIVAGERRLADAHFNYRAASPAIERAEGLDGDEIRVRLITLNDDKPPSLADAGRVLVAHVGATRAPRYVRAPLGRPAPRGPPAAAASAT